MGFTEEQGLTPEDIEIEHQVKKDYNQDSYQMPVDFNLYHLTLSEETLEFFRSDENLCKVFPLIDQIVATNYLDDRGVELYRSMVTSLIIDLQIFMDEDDEEGFTKLNTARTYMFMLIDACKRGYRGRLATEVRRVYRTESEGGQTRRRRFGIF